MNDDSNRRLRELSHMRGVDFSSAGGTTGKTPYTVSS